MKLLKKFAKRYKSFLVKCAILLVTIFAAFGIIKIADYYLEKFKLSYYPFEIMRHEAQLSYNEYKSELVKEVKNYIDSVAPTSSLNAYALVEACEKYDLDIKFVLAQGQIESHFGTTGMAIKTNSVFNVGAYDNLRYEEINGKYKYRHPDYSIEPYMRLLYRDYITGTKTELDLMVKFVNKNGKAYSSNPNYERALLNLFKKIDNSTNMTRLQGEIRRFKIISGS